MILKTDEKQYLSWKMEMWLCEFVGPILIFWYSLSKIFATKNIKMVKMPHSWGIFYHGELQELREQMCVWVLAKKFIAKKDYSWWFEVVIVPSFICSWSKNHIWQREF